VDRPLILSAQGDATVCRLAFPTAPDGRWLVAAGRPGSYPEPRGDPRLIRPFLWEDIYGRDNPFLEPWYNVAAVILALVTIVLPEILARWAARRRRGLALLLILPVIVGIVLTAYRVALRYAPVLSQMPAHGPGSRPVVFLVMLGLGFAAIVFVR